MKFFEKISNKIIWFIKEWLKTYSDQPSFFSSKRFERCILFVNSMILLDVFCYKNISKMTTEEILVIFAAQMVYVGYQVTQIRKDIQMNNDLKTAETKKDEN